MNLSLFLESASGWVLMFLGLGFLVFVHELGHFLMAVRAGVNVEVFSIGIGPFIVSTTYRGTVYALSLVPFGGYVRMTGQTDLVVERKGPIRPDSYMAKGPGARALILAAGASMNILIAFFLFVLALAAGARFVPAEIGEFRPDDARYAALVKAGIAPGDRVLSVGGTPVDRFDWDLMQIVAARGEGEVSLRLRRKDGSEYDATLETFTIKEIGLATLNIPVPKEKLEFRFGAGGPWGVLLRVRPKDGAESGIPDFTFVTAAAVEGADEAKSPSGPGIGAYLVRAIAEAGRAGRKLELTLFDGAREWQETLEPRLKHRAGMNLDVNLEIVALPEGHPAAAAGVRVGERIVSFNSVKPADLEDLISLIATSGGEPFEIELEGKEHGTGGCSRAATSRRTVKLRAGIASGEGDYDWYLAIRGGRLLSPIEGVMVREVVPGSPAEGAGLQPGDVLGNLGMRGRGRSAQVVWLRRGEEKTYSARVRLIEGDPTLEFEVEKRMRIDANPVVRGARDLVFSIRMVASVLGGLFRGRVGSRAISGPLGIGRITKASTELGFGNFLWILAMISANLGVINLLPVPILDGGHLVFIAYEKLRGKPVSARVQEIALYLGLALILMLVAVAMRNDISNIFLSR